MAQRRQITGMCDGADASPGQTRLIEPGSIVRKTLQEEIRTVRYVQPFCMALICGAVS